MEQQARHALEENVEQNSHRVEWPVYEYYKFIIGEAGKQYLYAPPAGNGIKKRLQPFSRVSADLFLRFAHWVEDPGMDKELDTARNAAAAKLWAEDFGVLGLNPPAMAILSLTNSTSVTSEYLGMPWL